MFKYPQHNEGLRSNVKPEMVNYAAKVKAAKSGALIPVLPLESGRVAGEWGGRGGDRRVEPDCECLRKPAQPFPRYLSQHLIGSSCSFLFTLLIFLLFQNFILFCFAQLHFLLPLLLPFNSLLGFFLCFFYLSLNAGFQGPIYYPHTFPWFAVLAVSPRSICVTRSQMSSVFQFYLLWRVSVWWHPEPHAQPDPNQMFPLKTLFSPLTIIIKDFIFFKWPSTLTSY